MKKKFFLYCLFAFLLNVTMFAQDNYNDFILQLESENYYLSCYFDVLKSQNREYLRNYDKYSNVFDDEKWEEPEGWVIHNWYEEFFFYFEKIEASRDLDQSIFNNNLVLGGVFIIEIESLIQDDKTIIHFTELGKGNEETWYNSTLLDWKILRKTNSNSFVLVKDGDYLKVYYDEDKMYPFAEYARMNKETFEQFKNLIYYNTCDLSRVTWPSHADGTCDYDDEIKPPEVQLSDNDSVAEEEEESATPSDTFSENEEDIETVEENVPVVKQTSSLPLVIIVASAVILLLCIVIILIVRKKKKQ
ncbi:MAG: hypothetical protein K6E97_01895 [Treponema sp.]|nr:hypothetical protein [Treponema sp.]